MLRIVYILSFFILMMVLSGCGINKAEYIYIPPQSKADKKCSLRCVKAKGYCQQICRLKHSRCFSRADRDMPNQYEAYKQKRMQKNAKVIKTWLDFDKNNPCYNACNCTLSFNTCYLACDGQVIEKKAGRSH